jgi:hypothetical protein
MDNPKTSQSTRTSDQRQPTFVVRAPDPNRGGKWITLGAAWKLKDGKDGFSIKLQSMPVGNKWDGTLVLLPSFEESET